MHPSQQTAKTPPSNVMAPPHCSSAHGRDRPSDCHHLMPASLLLIQSLEVSFSHEYNFNFTAHSGWASWLKQKWYMMAMTQEHNYSQQPLLRNVACAIHNCAFLEHNKKVNKKTRSTTCDDVNVLKISGHMKRRGCHGSMMGSTPLRYILQPYFPKKRKTEMLPKINFRQFRFLLYLKMY